MRLAFHLSERQGFLGDHVVIIGYIQGRLTVKDIGWVGTKRVKHAKSRRVWGYGPPGNFEK